MLASPEPEIGVSRTASCFSPVNPFIDWKQSSLTL